jgi:ABC-type transport system substrate-binding protein
MSKLIDREAMIRDVYFGAGFMNAGIFMPSLDWHLPESEVKELLPYDPQDALQLLSAAGVDRSQWQPVLDYGTPTRVNPGSTEIYLAELKKHGIEATVHFVDRVEVTDRVYGRGETEICLCNNAPTRGINSHLFTFFHSSGRFASLFKQLNDRSWDEAIERQSVTLDVNERKRLVQDIQRKNIELAIAAPVATDFIQSAYNPKLRDFKNMPTEDRRWAVAWLAS